MSPTLKQPPNGGSIQEAISTMTAGDQLRDDMARALAHAVSDAGVRWSSPVRGGPSALGQHRRRDSAVGEHVTDLRARCEAPPTPDDGYSGLYESLLEREEAEARHSTQGEPVVWARNHWL